MYRVAEVKFCHSRLTLIVVHNSRESDASNSVREEKASVYRVNLRWLVGRHIRHS